MSNDLRIWKFTRPALLVLALFVSAPWAGAETVHTEAGLVSSVPADTVDGVEVFKGIPYAAPPVGDLRWRPPAPAASWEGVRPCDTFGSKAPQRSRGGAEMNEDCLYLNVWTTAGGSVDEKLPVMVWIHGGGFTSGSGHEGQYNGEHFAGRGVVLVTINYRLGPLGFYAHPALSAESDHDSSGNYGILDQIAALKWVQKNIANFGGDPSNVTIFGESAGGTAVYLLHATPLSKGLFHRVISESAWITDTNVAHLREESRAGASVESRGIEMAESVVGEAESNPIEALRALPVEEIMEKMGRGLPVAVDGWLLPDFPDAIFREGHAHDVPLIAGTNSHEGNMFAGGAARQGVDGFQESLKEQYGEHAEKVLALYPIENEDALFPAASQHITDTWFLRPTREMARSMDQLSSPTFVYQFTREPPNARRPGASHAAEIRYVFNTHGGRNMDDTDLALADAMIRYWVQFATTGDPNVDGLPAWPAYDSESDRHLELGDAIKTGQGLRREELNVLDSLRLIETPEYTPGEKESAKELRDAHAIAAKLASPADRPPPRRSRVVRPAPTRDAAQHAIVLDRKEIGKKFIDEFVALTTKVDVREHKDANGKVIGLTSPNISQIELAGVLGFQDNDILTSIDNRLIDSANAIIEALKDFSNAKSYRVGIIRDGKQLYLNYTLRDDD